MADRHPLETLATVVSAADGLSPARPIQFAPASAGASAIPVLRPADLGGATSADVGDDELAFAALGTPGTIAERGDVVVALAGAPGRTALVGEESRHGRYLLSGDLARLRPDRAVVEPAYLRLALEAPTTRRQLEALSAGMTLPRVSIRDLATVRIALPPLTDQRAIVATVALLDRKLATLQSTASTLERIATTHFMRIAASAAVTAEGALEDHAGPVDSERPTPAQERAVIRPKRLPADSIVFGSWPLEGEPGAARQAFEHGDLLLARASSGGIKTVIAPGPGFASTGLAVLRPVKPELGPWLAFALRSATAGAGGAVEPRSAPLRWRELAAQPVPSPSEAALQRFDELAKPVVRRLHAAARESKAIAGIRAVAFPALIDGSLPVEGASW